MISRKTAHPNPIRKRENWMSLNGEWEFSFEKDSYDSSILVPFSWASPASGVFKDVKGTGYYRKKVSYRPKLARLFLVILASDYETRVTVNGTLVASHTGGYTPIEAEVTDVWKKDGENIIEAEVTDFDERCQTYGKQGYGNIRGIWQSVYLEERPESYIENFTVRTEVNGQVHIAAQVSGTFDEICCIFETPGAEPVSAASKTADFTLCVPQPKLWSPDEPNLYFGTLSLVSGQNMDKIQTYFGIREIGAEKRENGVNYITLNRRPIYVNATLDQSFNPKGFFTLESDQECENEILRLKNLGLNGARIHIKTEEPLKLYYADLYGIMIIQDLPCYWGEPEENTRKQFDLQLASCMARDINHPCIVQWVLYNETWGLFTGEGENKKYLPETQKWVAENYRKAKALDPTRLVEDNSPCNRDHTLTDINTYHFYANGYQEVKDVITEYAEGAYPGSSFNFAQGWTCPDVPHMNSECGDVWGIEGSAGDSDLSWHYHYMMNEFRLHENCCGFVFTEFHDVPNEFNGYYRIDNSEKIFGYDSYVPGMTVKDLHAQDFVCFDYAPMTSLAPGETVSVPLFLSTFSGRFAEESGCVKAEIMTRSYDGMETLCGTREFAVYSLPLGLHKIGDLAVTAPQKEAVVIVRLYLLSADRKILMRNFLTFDVTDGKHEGVPLDRLEIRGDGFLCQEGNKLNALSDTAVVCRFDGESENLFLTFEASSREIFTKDHPKEAWSSTGDYMMGYKVDRGANPNCFFMTTAGRKHLSVLHVTLNGHPLQDLYLQNDPADARGCLSWHYQKSVRKLDEAGTYGYICKVFIPASMMQEKNELVLQADRGFSLYGRKSGRYPVGFSFRKTDL